MGTIFLADEFLANTSKTSYLVPFYVCSPVILSVQPNWPGKSRGCKLV